MAGAGAGRAAELATRRARCRAPARPPARRPGSWTSRVRVLEEALQLLDRAVGRRAGTRPGRTSPARSCAAPSTSAESLPRKRSTLPRTSIASPRSKRAPSTSTSRKIAGRDRCRSGRAARGSGRESRSSPVCRSLRATAKRPARGRPGCSAAIPSGVGARCGIGGGLIDAAVSCSFHDLDDRTGPDDPRPSPRGTRGATVEPHGSDRLGEREPPELRSRCSSRRSRAGTTPPAPPATALGAVADSRRDRARRPDRSRGVLRLPGQPADDRAHRGADCAGVEWPDNLIVAGRAREPSATCC